MGEGFNVAGHLRLVGALAGVGSGQSSHVLAGPIHTNYYNMG